jgi:hypothetical protein
MQGGEAEMRDRSEQAEAIRLGLRRAGLHWIRAGYEVIAGVGALLDEVNRARREAEADSLAGGADRERIEIE